MGKLIFSISYEVKTDKRREYLALMDEMKEHLAVKRGKNYAVFELKGKNNFFTEMFYCDSREDYDKLEDDQDEKTEELIKTLETLLVNGKMKYSTLVEID